MIWSRIDRWVVRGAHTHIWYVKQIVVTVLMCFIQINTCYTLNIRICVMSSDRSIHRRSLTCSRPVIFIFPPPPSLRWINIFKSPIPLRHLLLASSFILRILLLLLFYGDRFSSLPFSTSYSQPANQQASHRDIPLFLGSCCLLLRNL